MYDLDPHGGTHIFFSPCCVYSSHHHTYCYYYYYHHRVVISIGTNGETVELFLRVFSSAMSVLVGAVWIGLTFFGKMEYIYGTAVTASDGGGGGGGSSERNELSEGEMVVA